MQRTKDLCRPAQHPSRPCPAHPAPTPAAPCPTHLLALDVEQAPIEHKLAPPLALVQAAVVNGDQAVLLRRFIGIIAAPAAAGPAGVTLAGGEQHRPPNSSTHQLSTYTPEQIHTSSRLLPATHQATPLKSASLLMSQLLGSTTRPPPTHLYSSTTHLKSASSLMMVSASKSHSGSNSLRLMWYPVCWASAAAGICMAQGRGGRQQAQGQAG